MKKIYKKILLSFLLAIFFEKVVANNFYDYPMFYLVEACNITQKTHNPN